MLKEALKKKIKIANMFWPLGLRQGFEPEVTPFGPTYVVTTANRRHLHDPANVSKVRHVDGDETMK